MSSYCPYTNSNVVYLQCKECDAKICEKDWFFCGVAATQQPMVKYRKQVAEYLDKMLAWPQCTPVSVDTYLCLSQTMICLHTFTNSSKKDV
jgi:hypothetical protein